MDKQEKTEAKKKVSTKKADSKPKKVVKKQAWPEIRPGYLVKVVHLAPDGKRNFTTEGIVMRVRGDRENKTFTVRRDAQGLGVEKVFAFANPALKELTVIKKNVARRARLYYLRSDKAKSSSKARFYKG